MVNSRLKMHRIPSRLWALSALSGALQILPFPIAGPVPVWRTAFCWIALLPLLYALLSRNSVGKPLKIREGAAIGYLAGVLWYLGNCYWIYPTMHLYGGIAPPIALGILVLFCLYLGLYHALFGALVAGFHRAVSRHTMHARQATLLFIPFAWVAVELARARVTGFPWDLLGITQVDNPLLTRLAPITGVYGLSFVIAAVNCLWLTPISIRERRHTRSLLTGVGVALILLYLAFARTLLQPIHEGGTATATLIQENLSVGAEDAGPQLTRQQMLRTFASLSLFPTPGAGCNGTPELPSTHCRGFSAAAEAAPRPLTPADVILWPESPAPFQEPDPELRATLAGVAHAARAALIADDITVERDPKRPTQAAFYNSAEFFTPSGQFAGRYDKIHLVPFGEYVPFRRLFFFAGSLLDQIGPFSSGLHRTLFTTGGHTFGTFICYESIFPDEVRQFAASGADVLVNLSDDGWYGDSSAPWEHLNMVRMRAIENHRWILRATNTGVTAAIDPYGRVVESAPRHLRTSLHVGFDYEHTLTFYTRHGDWFPWLCAILTALALALSAFPPRPHNTPQPPATADSLP